MAVPLSEVAKNRTQALREANAAGIQLGETIAGSRYSQNLSAAGTLGGLMNQTVQGRRVIGQTTTETGSQLGDLVNTGMLGVTHPDSYFNREMGGNSGFMKKLFGGGGVRTSSVPASTTDFGFIPEIPDRSELYGPPAPTGPRTLGWN
jgi:hypothetical protein